MLSRPKPGESEEDLLEFQNQFLASRTSAAATVVRKADKRKGTPEEATEGDAGGAAEKDVVSLQDFSDMPPILTPGPTKKSKVAEKQVHFAEEDPEYIFEKHDQHITAVISKIIERDTSSSSITAPVPTGEAFPRVFHRSEITSAAVPKSGKVSIFAQKMAAKRASEAAKGMEASTAHPPHGASVDLMNSIPSDENKSFHTRGVAHVDKSHVVTGEGLRSAAGHEEAERIHKENMERLKTLSQEEIIQERDKLMSQLDPKLIAFLRSKRENPTTQENTGSAAKPRTVSMEHPHHPTVTNPSEPTASEEEENPGPLSADELPVKPQKEWVHMGNVEFEKLEWTKNLPQTRQKKTKKGMQARFSLKGDLIPPDADMPTHLGLHHHGEEAERAGYSLQELFHLSRSQFIQQRTLSLQVLGRIVRKAKQGEFASILKGSVLRLLLDAGFLFLLRFSIDDPIDNVISTSVGALHSLLVSQEDEEYLDKTFSWYQGTKVFPFIPNQEEGEEEEEDEDETEININKAIGKADKQKDKEEKKADPDVARYDAIKGLLKTKFHHRLRYILEVVRPPALVVLQILDILTRVARHSAAACSQLLDCPRLMETVVREFLPMQWSMEMETDTPGPSSLHGVPCAAAMKFLRVLASSGRHAAARLLNTFDMRSRLSRFVAQEPQDLPLVKGEAERLSTETFRFWAIAAGYGQACDLYRDLYPVLLGILQSFPTLITSCKGNTTPPTASIHRAAAVITLLSHVSQTAACTAELEAQLHSTAVDTESQIPPPPVSWADITGLLPVVEGCLRRCLQEISHCDTWDLLQPLTTTSINFMASYYKAASRQPSLNTVLCNEEVEKLTDNVLLPFLRHAAVQSMWDSLRSCSAVSNPLSCSPLPESVNSIVTLSCAGGKPSLSLPGKSSPYPILTAVLNLICSVTNIHKGLVSKFSFIWEYKGLQNYLRKISECPSPPVTPSSSWLLRHEYHLQYFVLSLLYKLAAMYPEHSQHASLCHSVSIVLLSRLLPGSEHLAHKIISSFTFNPTFMPEGSSGGPQAADLSDRLHITSDSKQVPPSSAAATCVTPSRGTLLEEAFKDLPSIRTCYLTHFAHMGQALNHSRVIYQERTCFVQTALLPEAKGPVLPSDWSFLPLINLYNKVTNAETRGNIVNTLPPDLVNTVTRNLQWIFLLENWRPGSLQGIPIAAKLARLACVFLTGSDLFLEGPVHTYTAALTVFYCQPTFMESLKLDIPLPGLASFYDFYMDLLEQFEGVSFGDPLFGTFVLLPLQRRFSVQLRLALFGEHVSSLRSLCVPLKEFPIPLSFYTSPPEDNVHLLRLYFRTLVTGALRQTWCPVLYVVAVSHLNSFIFSQEHVAEEVDAERKSMLRKTHLMVDVGLKKHLLYYKHLSSTSPVGFELYDALPPLREKYLKTVTERQPQAKDAT
ncbi:RNA polymerase II-associated protein 1 [Hyla sarda]|uniref:RNA polymerase II-associated protein 1 n=1 Tax=Hyla sarda TaxID=327740 RepID=UPI0024C25C2D|nr:RNA polymerase II-associated protein 1 [Hyla sarda]XP_056401559.1 RNA polymerase II-associated protein 1 [Hyla sarda]XP_056401560.1 RNA polymerase II-associated protein 1 [Hyla sarda]XP_056401561.1 RNA polymerase II-associated protein 1 [Hyla sarda]